MKIQNFVLGMVGTNCYLVVNEEEKQCIRIDPAVYSGEIAEEINEGIFRKTDDRNHIGMENAITRIRMYYGNQARVRVESQSGAGTTVEVRIPIS